MIGRLTGTLLEKNPPQILIDAHGVGYEVDVPMSTFYGLPATGQAVVLHTHLAIREDGHFLYGFATTEERAAFRQLLKVSGIGARTALAVLSGLSVSDLAQAVALQEAGRLIKVPGIGKKTAERLLLELRDKLGGALPTLAGSAIRAGAPATGPADARTDILNALLALGYNEREALGAMKGLDAGVGVSEGIRLALRHLSKG
ncbi:Holliday junction branch migration protein RuvA [Pseudothauera nasutitermitis]|uniref:Holliday junction branch migration complex subunit RuvA n=1 Tax=Pseudothauera nasutitermitis TaxID=2565930 RepID=A0A4S4ATA5_9RHOO|nr:Holliday junction branch migration protein RuvA [Pseudothauera nasutitermitis]THF63094.1 Holliday junction branch migration protein RuvA [Pseudothauera nasutitermitis]